MLYHPTTTGPHGENCAIASCQVPTGHHGRRLEHMEKIVQLLSANRPATGFDGRSWTRSKWGFCKKKNSFFKNMNLFYVRVNTKYLGLIENVFQNNFKK